MTPPQELLLEELEEQQRILARLVDPQKVRARLRQKLSDISDAACDAQWLLDVEYVVWKAMHQREPMSYYMIDDLSPHLPELRAIAAVLDGWETYEGPVTRIHWDKLYNEWLEKQCEEGEQE
jgi:hypothetical protein